MLFQSLSNCHQPQHQGTVKKFEASSFIVIIYKHSNLLRCQVCFLINQLVQQKMEVTILKWLTRELKGKFN